MAEKHFTALIEIIEVTPEHQLETGSRSFSGEPKVIPRSTSEVAKLVLRADSVEELVDKAVRHLELVKPQPAVRLGKGAKE